MSETRVRPPEWHLNMTAEPVIPAWTSDSRCDTNGAELQDAILKGFGDPKNAVWSPKHGEFTFEKEFNFAEHGEFFRGALTMAKIRYARDFYELLERYGRIRVTIRKEQRVQP
jgi:hypothetical protein